MRASKPPLESSFKLAFYNILKKDQVMENVIKKSKHFNFQEVQVYFVVSFVVSFLYSLYIFQWRFDSPKTGNKIGAFYQYK